MWFYFILFEQQRNMWSRERTSRSRPQKKAGVLCVNWKVTVVVLMDEFYKDAAPSKFTLHDYSKAFKQFHKGIFYS